MNKKYEKMLISKTLDVSMWRRKRYNGVISGVKDVEMAIEEALDVTNRERRQGPAGSRSLLGQITKSEEKEMSLEDLIENDFMTDPDEMEVYNRNVVKYNWLKMLKRKGQYVVLCRCSGMGWKKLARILVKKGCATRELHPSTLKETYNKSIQYIYNKVR